MKPLSICAVLLAASSLLSCSKDKKDDPTPPTKTELLSNKDWVTSAVVATYNGTPIDVYNNTAFFPACQKDNILRFSPDKTYNVSEGAVSCAPPSTETGAWALSTDETKLTRTPPSGSATTADILELTDTSLKVSQAGNYQGIPVTVTFTFQKK